MVRVRCEAGATVSYWAARWPGILKLWALIGYELELPFTLQVDADAVPGLHDLRGGLPQGRVRVVRWTRPERPGSKSRG